MKKLCFLLLLFSSFLSSYSQAVWELEKDASGIQVYTRKVSVSSIKEYKATTLIKTSLKLLVNKIIDGEHLKDWNYKTTKSSLLEKKSDTEYFVYMYNNLPWPAKNRDHISELKLAIINSSLTKINIKSAPKKLTEKRGVIRVVDFSGFWLLEKTKLGVKVTQQMHGDPGGSLPAFIVNAMLVNAPYHTLKQLKEQLDN
jgi:DNA-directed RNA polymerase beta' subunit